MNKEEAREYMINNPKKQLRILDRNVILANFIDGTMGILDEDFGRKLCTIKMDDFDDRTTFYEFTPSPLWYI